MDRGYVAVLATVLAGGLVALQAPVNSVLGRSVGTFAAASINFATGTVLLVTITLVLTGGFGSVGGGGPPWYYWIGGGVVGAAYVTTVLLAVRQLGAGGVTAATITGQLAASVILDRFGALGLAERSVTPARAVGVGLLIVGTVLVAR